LVIRSSSRAIAIAIVAVLAVIASTRRFLPNLVSRYRYDGDARQHVWWTYRFADPELFAGDLAAEYFSAYTFSPIGYQLLARLAVPLVDAQTFAEIVPFFLTAIVAVLAAALGRAVSGGSWFGAVVASAFALLGGLVARIDGGLPRAWAIPVLLLGWWAIITRRRFVFGLSLVAAALFYPPVILNLGIVGGLAFAMRDPRAPRLRRSGIALGALAAGASLLLAFAYAPGMPDAIGPRVTEEVARKMPEFGHDGRTPFFSADPIDFYVASERAGLGTKPWKLFLFASIVALGTWIVPRATPFVVWLIPAAAIACWAAAHATLFALHAPSRYVRYAFPTFIMIWLAAIVPAAWERARRFGRTARVAAVLAQPRVLVPVVAAALAYLATETVLHVRKEISRPLRPGFAEMIEFVCGLPKRTLIAAHPSDASNVPLLARRSVIACEETAAPYHLGYYDHVRERIAAELAATFATDWDAVDRLSDRYGVSVFLVDRARYRRPVDPERVYFEPFRTGLRALIARGNRDGFVLENPPETRVLFRSGDFLAVSVNGRATRRFEPGAAEAAATRSPGGPR
jgi:hypothetical protein